MFDEITPFKKGFVAALFFLMIAVLVFTQKYLPYNQYRKLEFACSEQTNGIVVEFEERDSDGVYFYGPMLEFEADGRTIRTYAVNTVQPEKTHPVGESLVIHYDPATYSDVLIDTDDDVKRQFRNTLIISGALCGAAIISLILGIAFSDHSKEIKTYFLNKDGETFEQWQMRQEQANDGKEKLSLEKPAETDTDGE